MSNKSNLWFYDHISEDLTCVHRVSNVLFAGKTRYQSVQVIETESYGRCLILDDKIQSSAADEFIYHESLVQPVMLAHPNPKTVFIAGGGEGATLREVLRNKSVERVVMVDLDKKVVDLCKKHLPSWHQGSFEDKRLELFHEDARAFLRDRKDKYDVIIIDIPDPIEEGPAYLLYTTEFYTLVLNRLRKDGAMSVQSGPCVLGNLVNFAAVHNTLKTVFKHVTPYHADVPAFGNPWGFNLASASLEPPATAGEVDKRIAARLNSPLRFYDGITHFNLFSIPKHIRRYVADNTRVITDKNPLFFYRA